MNKYLRSVPPKERRWALRMARWQISDAMRKNRLSDFEKIKWAKERKAAKDFVKQLKEAEAG